MRMNPRNLQSPSELTESNLHSGNLEPLVRFIQRHKQRRVLILPGLKVLLQMYFGAGIEINDSLLVALSEYNAFALVEVYIRAVELHQLPDTHSGG